MEHIRKLISEELASIMSEKDFNYAASEREYHDKENYEAFEAEISAALSFFQDISGSMEKINGQKELMGTDEKVDKHLSEAMVHIKQARRIYFENLSPDVKAEVVERLGEISKNQ